MGDDFTGVISTVTNFGLFVRLQDLHIEGLVHITALGRDYYHYDDVRMCLKGENSGVKYSVGDVVTVQVAAVNLDEKKIDLTMQSVDDNDDKSNKKPNRKPKKSSSSKTAAPQKEKSKTKKRSARKKRPGKNARKNVKPS